MLTSTKGTHRNYRETGGHGAAQHGHILLNKNINNTRAVVV